MSRKSVARDVVLDAFFRVEANVVAYPPRTDKDDDWVFQLNAYPRGATFSVSGISRNGVEALRDALDVLLVETES